MIRLFEAGQVVATPGALNLLAVTDTSSQELLNRHLSGDWGDISEDDAAENRFSLEHGFRVLRRYKIGADRVWIITEADRSVTTFLLPAEY